MTEGSGSGIRIQFALKVWVWIRIRSISDRIRNTLYFHKDSNVLTPHISLLRLRLFSAMRRSPCYIFALSHNILQ